MSWLKRIQLYLTIAALGVGASGCMKAVSSKSADADVSQFFANSSKRRDATEAESKLVVKVGGCTAFFVENTKGDQLMISARHCFNYSSTEWCARGSSIVTNDGQRGKCVSVEAGDAQNDIVLFRVQMPFVPNESQTLQLAAFVPAQSQQLKMIGYPADQFRKGRLSVTENCWTLSGMVGSPHVFTLKLNDPSQLHNCTTYGGNSGGPMIANGTRIAIGLPFTYMPNDYNERSPNATSTAAHLALMSEFVARNRVKLDSLGAVIANGLNGSEALAPTPAPTAAPTVIATPIANFTPNVNPTANPGASSGASCMCALDSTDQNCTLYQGNTVISWAQYRPCNRSTCSQLFSSGVANTCGGNFSMGRTLD